ncbi:MAG: WXG100 family type VII secretion target [Pseudonocardiaceae bacterium]
MGVKVNYDLVRDAASKIGTAKGEMEDQLKRLHTMVQNLQHEGFQTDLAAPKFQDSYTQWNTGANNVVGGLDGMSGFLNNVITQHQSLDQSLQQSAGSA